MRHEQLVSWCLDGYKSSRRGGRSALLILSLLGAGVGGVARAQTITEFAVPSGFLANYIAAGPDHNLWFAEGYGGWIDRISTDGVVTEFDIPTANSFPQDIAVGPDGNLWFTDEGLDSIGRITTAGVITEFALPAVGAPPLYNQPHGIATGPDGNLWFTEIAGNQIGRVTTTGVITEFPIATPDSQPMMIAAGPDGNLWFAEYLGNRIGRITTGGVITEFSLPTAGSYPEAIAAGPDGSLWFTEATVSRIGRISTAGVVNEFSIPHPAYFGIAAGPDGNLWFTENRANRIGRLCTPPTRFVIRTFRRDLIASRTSNLQADVEAHEGSAYEWTISNGTIVSGQGTNSISFQAGTEGPVSLDVVETQNGCSSRHTRVVPPRPSSW